MADEEGLRIDYAAHPVVDELIDVITFCLEGISLEFDRWDDSYVQGPGLYFVVVAGTSVDAYADPMGSNRWPVEECTTVTAVDDSFYETAIRVAVEQDGAVVVTVDGTVYEQMVRLKDIDDAALPDGESLTYADWMGARHMSAVDTSARDEVIAAITLSEESGRVTVFTDGSYTDYSRDELGKKWRSD